MSYFDRKQLTEERGAIVKQLNDMAANIAKEQRVFTAEETAQFDKLQSANEDLKAKIESALRVDKAIEEGLRTHDVQFPSARPQTRTTALDRDLALRALMLRGKKEQRNEFVDAAEKCGLDLSKQNGLDIRLTPIEPWWVEKRNGKLREERSGQSANTAGAGADLEQQSEIIRQIDIALKWHSGMRLASKVLRTPNGIPYFHPTVNDTSNVATANNDQNAENTAPTETDFTFSQVEFKVATYNTGAWPISVQLIEDAAIPVLEVISELLGVRIARKQNTDFTSATNTTPPWNGLVPSISNTFTTASTGKLTYQDYVGAVYALDKAYRSLPSYGLMLSDDAVRNAWSLVDNNGRPLMSMDADTIEPRDRLLGYPVIVNNDLGTVAAGNTVGVFGAFEKSVVRDVGDINLRILNEYFLAQYLAIGVIAWMRSSYAVVNPGAFYKVVVHA